jgi:hypothetical protein
MFWTRLPSFKAFVFLWICRIIGSSSVQTVHGSAFSSRLSDSVFSAVCTSRLFATAKRSDLCRYKSFSVYLGVTFSLCKLGWSAFGAPVAALLSTQFLTQNLLGLGLVGVVVGVSLSLLSASLILSVSWQRSLSLGPRSLVSLFQHRPCSWLCHC